MQFYWWMKLEYWRKPQPAASHWQIVSHNCIECTSPWTEIELATLVVIGTDCTGSWKYINHTITTMTASHMESRVTDKLYQPYDHDHDSQSYGEPCHWQALSTIRSRPWRPLIWRAMSLTSFINHTITTMTASHMESHVTDKLYQPYDHDHDGLSYGEPCHWQALSTIRSRPWQPLIWRAMSLTSFINHTITTMTASHMESHVTDKLYQPYDHDHDGLSYGEPCHWQALSTIRSRPWQPLIWRAMSLTSFINHTITTMTASHMESHVTDKLYQPYDHDHDSLSYGEPCHWQALSTIRSRPWRPLIWRAMSLTSFINHTITTMTASHMESHVTDKLYQPYDHDHDSLSYGEPCHWQALSTIRSRPRQPLIWRAMSLTSFINHTITTMTASHMESHVTDKLYQPYDHDHDSLSYGEPCHWQALSTIRSRPWQPLIWRAMSLTSFINHTITTTTASHMESHVTDKLYQPYDHDHDGLSYGEPCHWQALSTIRSRPWQPLIWRAMSLTSFINHTITTMTASHMESHVTDKLYQPYDHDHDSLSYGEPCHWQALSTIRSRPWQPLIWRAMSLTSFINHTITTMTVSHMESHVTDKLYQPYDHDHDSLSYGEPCHWQALSTIRSRPWQPLIWRAMSLTSFINHTITTMTASHMESHVTDKLYQPYDHDHDSLSYGEPCHWQALSTIRSRPRRPLIWRAMSLTSFINHTITTMTASHMESHVTDKLYQPYDHDHDSLSYGEPCHWQALSTIRSRPWQPLIWRAMSLTSFINHTITTMTASHMESHVTDKLYQPYDHDHDGLSYGEPCHWQALSTIRSRPWRPLIWRAMSLTSFINHTITTMTASHMESHVTDKLYQPYDHDHDSLSYGEPCHWQALSTIRSRPRQPLIWRAMSLTSFINHTITTMTASHMESHVTDKLYQPYDHDHDGLSYGEPCHWQALSTIRSRPRQPLIWRAMSLTSFINHTITTMTASHMESHVTDKLYQPYDHDHDSLSYGEPCHWQALSTIRSRPRQPLIWRAMSLTSFIT